MFALLRYRWSRTVIDKTGEGFFWRICAIGRVYVSGGHRKEMTAPSLTKPRVVGRTRFEPGWRNMYAKST
jgi:hypothetical protein